METINNEHFRQVLAFLKENRYIRNNQDFTERVGTNKSTISLIVNDRIPTPNKLFDSILKTFPFINKTFLLTGEGEMLNESAEAATEQAADTNVNASTIVGANVSGNGHTISNTTDSDNTALMELQKGFQNLLAKSQEQTTKAQEQIDELLQQHKTLISIIEKKL